MKQKRNSEQNNQFWQKCRDIDSFMGSLKAREVWKTLKNFRQNTHERVGIEPIQMDEWVTYYPQLLQEKRYLYTPTIYEIRDRQTQIEEISENVISYRAGGPRDIPARTAKTRLFELNTKIKTNI